MNPSSTRRWLIAVLAALGMLTATGAYAQTDNTPPTVTSVGYYADASTTIPITAAFLDTNIYIVIRFSENVRNINTVFPSVSGRPGITVRPQSSGDTRINIVAHNTPFTAVNACRAKSMSDTSEYLCQFSLNRFAASLGRLQTRLVAGQTRDLFNNIQTTEYLDDGIDVVETTTVIPSVTSVSHYSDADRTTTISGTVTGGSIYSVIQFSAGLAIGTELADPPDTRPQIFYQIGTDLDQRVQFGGHATGTPQNGTCALLDSGGTAMANQSFWCRYNTRSNDEGTYQIMVGTSTTDIAGQALAAEYTSSSVTLSVTVGRATLSIADVSVNEGDGMATVTVMVNEAVSGGFRVDAMTTDGGSATAGEDYTATTKELIFTGTTANETQTFTVPIIDDTIYEGGPSSTAETVMVSLANLQDTDETNVDISAVALIRIIDNDYEVVLTMGDVSVREREGGVATVTVRLNAAVPDTFSVDISTADGSAIAGEDYITTNQTLTFTSTVETQTFSVPITNDTTKEFPETLTVSLGNLQVTIATGTGTLRPATATITISDDDLGDNSINLNLIFPVTDNGKTYYYLDNIPNGIAEHGGLQRGDRVTHTVLDRFLNNGSDTRNTQTDSEGHDGSDDQRSVIIGDTVLILPTPAEFRALRASRTNAGEDCHTCKLVEWS